MGERDPRTRAVEKFASSAGWVNQLDVITRCATDPPLAIDILSRAATEELTPGGRVCELGFGSGWLLDELSKRQPRARLHGFEMSAAAIRLVRGRLERVALVAGDMEQLPFRDGAFDAVVTCFTLYFMNDIDRALAEMRRCVRPGGRAIVATVGRDHMREYDETAREAVRVALGRNPEDDMAVRFDLESGAEHMRRNFDNVELREWHGELRLPDVESALTIWPTYGIVQQDAREDAAARDEFARRVGEVIDRDGVFRVRRHDGAFVARL